MENVIFMLRFKLCPVEQLSNYGRLFTFFKFGIFCQWFIDLLFEGSKGLTILNNLNFNTQYFEFKCSLQNPKPPRNPYKPQKTLTNPRVFWLISKSNKIRDQGMEFQFFVLCLEICVRGLGFKLRVGFCEEFVS